MNEKAVIERAIFGGRIQSILLHVAVNIYGINNFDYFSFLCCVGWAKIVSFFIIMQDTFSEQDWFHWWKASPGMPFDRSAAIKQNEKREGFGFKFKAEKSFLHTLGVFMYNGLFKVQKTGGLKSEKNLSRERWNPAATSKKGSAASFFLPTKEKKILEKILFTVGRDVVVVAVVFLELRTWHSPRALWSKSIDIKASDEHPAHQSFIFFFFFACLLFSAWRMRLRGSFPSLWCCCCFWGLSLGRIVVDSGGDLLVAFNCRRKRKTFPPRFRIRSRWERERERKMEAAAFVFESSRF